MNTTRANKRLYIAYGSNMNVAQMARRCPGAEIVTTATLESWRLTFQGSPHNAHANIMRADGTTTPVVIWAISEGNEINLDRYEGVAGGYYRKEYLPVAINDETHNALVYIMTPQPYNTPSPSYLHGIAEAYKAAGFDPCWLYAAFRYAADHAGTMPEEYREESQE